jgi:hypothetical protein
MNEGLGLVIMCCAFMAFMVVMAIAENTKEAKIATECVKAGSEWKTTVGGSHECVRKGG